MTKKSVLSRLAEELDMPSDSDEDVVFYNLRKLKREKSRLVRRCELFGLASIGILKVIGEADLD